MKALLCLIVLSFLALSCSAGDTTEDAPIALGFIAPLSGDAAAYGETELDAARMAIEEVNTQGGVRGRQIEIIPEDGQCEGRPAASAAQKLIGTNEVKIILGGACSAETLAIAPISEAQEVLLFSSFSSNPDIASAGEFIFRNVPTDDDWAPAAARTVRSDGHTRIAMLSEKTDYAMGARSIFAEEIERLGGSLVADELFGSEDADYRTQILKIREASPEAVFLNPQSDVSAARTARQLREMGVDAPVYSSFVWSSPNAIEGAGSAAEGIVFLDVPGLSGERGKNFLLRYQQAYGEPANEYIAGARYDSIFILADALTECAEDTACIKEYLEQMPPYEGVVGTYSFSEEGDVVGIEFVRKRIVDGEVRTLQ